MLRLPPFRLLKPKSLDEAIAMLAEPGPDGRRPRILAGGTDLLVNMKQGIAEADVLVSLTDLDELRGVREEDGDLVIGAMTPISEVASHALVRERAPALSQAAGLISSPQLRAMGTIGGNVLLDTRCQWINQSHFWRESLGFCLKKDGTVCHVIQKGNRCVAAASNDTAPPLITLNARLTLVGTSRRELAVGDLWTSDGTYHLAIESGELLVDVRVPATVEDPGITHHGAYGKLRNRGSIDFPLLGIAVRLDLDDAGVVRKAAAAAVALQARPLLLPKVAKALTGVDTRGDAFEAALDAAAEAAHKRCHPLDNIPGDAWWRREMGPVLMRRTLRAALDGTGPVTGSPQ